ncbi:MAG: hypothetical protein ACOX6U_08665 [Oscillospiraceae bacterium]|jgi:hypothetical protein
MKRYGTIVKKQYALLLLLIAVLCISACSAPASEPQNPIPNSEPSSSNNISEGSTFNPNEYVSGLESEVKTVPPERLVEYYEGQLDPEIPKITVMATITEEDGETTCPLPYDASLRSGDEKTEMDREKTWFLNLMNNFWSLPKLHDGLQNLSVPSQITITFSEPPVGEIAITDYVIVDDSGIATKGTPTLSHSYDRTQTFSPAGNTLSFDLWVYDGVDLMSVQPPLRGMMVHCTIDEKKVEYYILFQTSYFLGMFPFDSDFSHLTPLEE